MIRVTVAFAALISLSAFNTALAEGDAVKGKKAFKKCLACHAVGEKAKNKVGPQLNDLFGRVPGSLEGYKYSKAMIAYGDGKEWDDELLAAYLAAPKKVIKGTKMSYAGLKKEADIANILEYLKTFDADEAGAS